MTEVAILGAGPAGLVAARYLASEGFEPTLFEQGRALGGQWSGDPAHSGVWKSMRTNTSRVLTAFSDAPHPAATSTYPSCADIGRYLRGYAAQFGLTERARLATSVRELRPNGKGGWSLTTDHGDEHFERVVVATGRFQHPLVPDVAGLDSFTGPGSVRHTSDYGQPADYAGLRVLVAGGAISALEIASDLAMSGARVALAQRRQRYVLPKLYRGMPTDHLMFTRYHALALESLPAEEVDDLFKGLVIRAGGDPRHYGAPPPAESLAEAGLTLSQFFLSLVAEGRIELRPWLESVDGNSVRFADGGVAEFDAIVVGTGFRLHLPFLSHEIRSTVDLDAHHIDLYEHTFHPDLPGLAFVGCVDWAGPYFPALELQARWVAYTWSGTIPAVAEDRLRAGIAAYRARRGGPQKSRMDVVAVKFARAAGVEPEPQRWPRLERYLWFGPLTPVSFRLSGPDALPDAPQRIRDEAAEFGCMTDDALSDDEAARLRVLAEARGSRSG